MHAARIRSCLALLAVSCAVLGAAGCADYCPIDVTRENLLGEIQKGDSLKIKTYANKKLRMDVTGVEDGLIKGRENADPRRPVWIGFGAVRALERECPERP
jgi:hypothetical protein